MVLIANISNINAQLDLSCTINIFWNQDVDNDIVVTPDMIVSLCNFLAIAP